jgi:hypothetical protein
MSWREYFILRTGDYPSRQVHEIRAHSDNIDTNSGNFQSFLGGGLDRFYPTAATKLKVASSSANDTAAGTGARTVELIMLSPTFEIETETIALNGQTPVETSFEAYRIQGARVVTAGSGGANAGTIRVAPTASTFTNGVPDTNPMWSVLPGWNTCSCGVYTVPEGLLATLDHLRISSFSGKFLEIRLEYRRPGDLWRVYHEWHVQDGGFASSLWSPLKLPSGTDIRLRARSGANDGRISAAVALILHRNQP